MICEGCQGYASVNDDHTICIDGSYYCSQECLGKECDSCENWNGKEDGKCGSLVNNGDCDGYKLRSE